jgi:hypothetical protein
MSSGAFGNAFDNMNERAKEIDRYKTTIRLLAAERDRYKAGLDDAMHLLMNHNHHADPEWVSGYEDLCNRYSKIKEG